MADSASTNTSLYNVQDVNQTVDTLRALGVRVEQTDTLPTVDFTEWRTHGAFISTGRITVTPDGRHIATLYDVGDTTQAIAVGMVVQHFLTGSTGHRNWRETTAEDGTTTIVLMVAVPLQLGIDYLEQSVLRDQLDMPGTCRTCGRRVRTYKLGEGGWVCGACRVEPTTFNGLAKRRLLWNRRDIANSLLQAEVAEREGAYAEAACLLDQADKWATPSHLDWQLGIVPREVRRAERRMARRERRTAQR